MFSLTIVFGGGSIVVWTLMFKTKETAEAAHGIVLGSTIPVRSDSVMSPAIDVTDDFGQRVCISRSVVHGVMLEEMELSKMAHVHRALHQAHTQAEAQKAASADPKLRMHSMMNGPAMLDPMGRGNGMRG